jgi:hypothetical protein
MVNGGELPRGSSEEGDNELVARAETAVAVADVVSPRRPEGVAVVVSPRRPVGVADVVSPRRPEGVAVVVVSPRRE